MATTADSKYYTDVDGKHGVCRTCMEPVAEKFNKDGERYFRCANGHRDYFGCYLRK